jgi:hypothetical protein
MKVTTLATAATSAALLSMGLSAPVAQADPEYVTTRGLTTAQAIDSSNDSAEAMATERIAAEPLDPKTIATEFQSVIAQNFEGRFTEQDMATLGAVVERAAADMTELDQIKAFFEKNFSPEELETLQGAMKERDVLKRCFLIPALATVMGWFRCTIM